MTQALARDASLVGGFSSPNWINCSACYHVADTTRPGCKSRLFALEDIHLHGSCLFLRLVVGDELVTFLQADAAAASTQACLLASHYRVHTSKFNSAMARLSRSKRADPLGPSAPSKPGLAHSLDGLGLHPFSFSSRWAWDGIAGLLSVLDALGLCRQGCLTSNEVRQGVGILSPRGPSHLAGHPWKKGPA